MTQHSSRGRISADLLDRILADARSDPRREQCGLLFGCNGVIDDYQPAANVHMESDRNFELDPAMLVGAERAMRGGGPQIIGHYHSHPAGPSLPSVIDAEMARADGRFWLIVGEDTHGLWLFKGAGQGDVNGFVRVPLLVSRADGP